MNTELNTTEAQWRKFFRFAAIMVFAAIGVMVSEIFLTMLPDGSRLTAGTETIGGWFSLFERNLFMGMRNLGLINVIATTLMIPVFFALFGLHAKNQPVLAGFSLMLFSLSYAVFISGNSTLAMLGIFEKWASATAEVKASLESAGEALVARGASHTSGTFIGFFLSELANVCISIVMIKGKHFARPAGYIGIVAFSLLFIFEVISSFIPQFFGQAMIFATIGGISAVAWYVFLGIGLLRASAGSKVR